MRLFAALPLSEDVAQVLATVSDIVSSSDAHWTGEKWVPIQNLHVTLRFFGEVPDSEVAQVLDVVEECAAATAAPRLALTSISATPSSRHARMIWAELLDVDDRAAGASTCLAHSLPLFGAEGNRRFRAHVTLCRARAPRALEAEALVAANALLKRVTTTMSVPVVSVLSSRLTPRGPVYTTIGTRRFGGE